MNRRAHSLLTAGVVLCTGVLLSSFVGWGFKQRVESEAADRFAFVCEQITQSIHRRLEAVELILRGGAGNVVQQRIDHLGGELSGVLGVGARFGGN